MVLQYVHSDPGTSSQIELTHVRESAGLAHSYAPYNTDRSYRRIDDFKDHASYHTCTPIYGTALSVASSYDKKSIVKLLLEKGATLDFETKDGTALCHAVEEGDISIAKLLLEKGAKAACALTPAVASRSFDLIHLLVSHGADVNTQGHDGNTTLHMAPKLSMRGATEAMGLLVQLGADVNLVNKSGRTVLMVAAEKGAEGAVQFLLQHDADTRLLDSRGKTAFEYAQTEGIQDLLRACTMPSFAALRRFLEPLGDDGDTRRQTL